MDIETLELADATREQAQAIERQTSALEAHVVALKSVSKGEQGDKGDTGDIGPQGETGPQGVRGLQGIKGDKGNTGGTGPKGDKGDKGNTGDAGKDGVGPDERVKVGIDDPRPGFLADKLEAGEGVTLKRKKSPTGHSLVINAFPQAGGSSGGGGSTALIVYDDGVAVGTGNKVSYDGGDPVTIAGGIIHVPVGSGGGGSDDQTAAEVPFTPAGTIAATNVQAAIEEVAAEATGAVSPLVLTSNDPAEVPLTLVPDAGQTEALLILENESAGEAVEAFANGSINQYLTDPAVIGWLIKMAAGQTASPLRIIDENDQILFDFVPGTGEIRIRTTGTKPDGDVQSSWYAQNFANYAESDLLMAVGHGKFELDTYRDYVTPANSYTHLDVTTQPSQQAGDPVTRLYNWDLSKYVHRILPSGAISTSGTVPADGDILTGEQFMYFDPTNGAASPMWKGKQADGTVVSGSLGGGSVTPATDPGDIADTTIVTAEDVGNKLNTLMGAMRTAGLLA